MSSDPQPGPSTQPEPEASVHAQIWEVPLDEVTDDPTVTEAIPDEGAAAIDNAMNERVGDDKGVVDEVQSPVEIDNTAKSSVEDEHASRPGRKFLQSGPDAKEGDTFWNLYLDIVEAEDAANIAKWTESGTNIMWVVRVYPHQVESILTSLYSGHCFRCICRGALRNLELKEDITWLELSEVRSDQHSS